jgi:hypothetical protein
VDFCVSKSNIADEEICDLTIANSNTIFTYPILPLGIEYVLLELKWIVCKQICDDKLYLQSNPLGSNYVCILELDCCVSKSNFADEEICDLTIANLNTIFTYPIQSLGNEICDVNT